MVSIHALWLPILLSAVFVFILSSIIHMALPYHRSDFGKVPDEDKVMDALRKFNIPAGDYIMPCAPTAKEMKEPGYQEKIKKGPRALITVFKAGFDNMVPSLIQWFVYCLVISLFAAYITTRAADSSADYLTVFRFAGATSFFAYAVALWQDSIWYKRKWSISFKNTVDGFIYALVTAGTFGWLWPA